MRLLNALMVGTLMALGLLTACSTPKQDTVISQSPSRYANATPLDLSLSALPYPYPVREFKTTLQGQAVVMSYMDVPAQGRQKGAVLLFHGKNFSSDYWAPTIAALSADGYRVIAPDQIGFGKSSKPDVPYHFDELAANTRALLISLKIQKVSVIANSMGSMLGIRFARLYPQVVQKLVLENPLGLEDYSQAIPAQTNERLLQLEMAQTEESFRRFLQSYFPSWNPTYEKFVEVYVRVQKGPDYRAYSQASVLTYQMIAEQPVVNDLSQLNMPVLLVIGQKDRTVFGRRFAPPEAVKTLGDFPQLGLKAAKTIPQASLVAIDEAGHVPHLESEAKYNAAVLQFLDGKVAR
ncbi:Pimeloyl-ACP methyl ester carboxylesterase [Polynucleobacter meluiroseus]|uniref:Pimeloyl-ACP methyl ester carboxylesterase n=1 Tax=Polynucleobacter meluiroseus TaxID=1938814 RepID=A0A240E213_9BURK|nr:alpha/beta hydrolase [Polynucleobacter meluiroseus]SNX29475.1 Pimeloyl-ACP methyl ester carboxylesterase [Polynucleobacter meluiroseus]